MENKLTPESLEVFLLIREEVDILWSIIGINSKMTEPLEELQRRLLNFENPDLVLKDFENWKLSCNIQPKNECKGR